MHNLGIKQGNGKIGMEFLNGQIGGSVNKRRLAALERILTSLVGKIKDG